MLSKFISVSETRFQNTETTLNNQQASIQGLETQIGQLSKLISKRPKGSLPSNTEPNPREHLNAISTQNKEGFIAPESELQQDDVMNKGREGVNNDNPKQEPSRTKTIETVLYYHEENKDIHEERRLQIEELDEWREHKPRTHDKPKLCKNKPDTSPNQLKVGDTVLLDAVDPHIVSTTPNEEIPLTVLSIFPFGTVEVSHSKFGTFKHQWTTLSEYHGHATTYTTMGEANLAKHNRVTRSCSHTTYTHRRTRRQCDAITIRDEHGRDTNHTGVRTGHAT
ncbi:hypothetical protein GOBAR_AA05794 [Gossypium barbadense]|uniref:Uncharacterized protein n=1 Tax=Gossypium barbadense TaxID=3634 RepID=A0A2P5YGR6_GOSBA|nr:hypothetical protein GOBAR_AA05794 [Gossypium barbadense]